ncbi:MAG: peptidase [Actinomycetota bacterium]
MIRHLVVAVVALAVLGAAPAAAAVPSTEADTPTAGSIGVRLLDVPSASTDDPRARLYIVDHLAPGTTIVRRIEITNTTTAIAHVAAYASAATIERATFLGSAGHRANDLSNWTSVTPAAPDIPAGGHAVATVTIRVPHDAAPGEQYAVVWAEARSPIDTGGVIQVNRVGIRLYVSVGPGGPPAADFVIDSLTARRAADSTPSVLATVRNLGGRALDMNGTLQLLAGPGGLRAGPFPAALGSTLGIGATEQVAISLDPRLPDGPWDARVVLRSGLVERTARATLTFPSSGAAPAVAVLPTDAGNRPPAAVFGLALLLLLAAAVLAVLWGRRRYRLRLAQLA